MPIVIAPLNQELEIIKILAEDKLKKHLESLGITIGTIVTALSITNGNVILKIKEGRLALDKGVATKILVKIK